MIHNNMSLFKGLLIGGLLGAAAGILFAPKSGKETREDICREAEDLLSRAREEYEAALDKAKNLVGRPVKKMGESQVTAP